MMLEAWQMLVPPAALVAATDVKASYIPASPQIAREWVGENHSEPRQ